LKQYYEENFSLVDGLKLIIKVLKKTLDKNKMSGDNIDILVLQAVDGELTQKFLPAKDIENYLKVIEQEEAEEKTKSDKSKSNEMII
jgi:20S proteasome alpha/beta subunit